MPLNVDATWANAPDASSDPVYDAADLRRADAALLAGTGTAPLGVRGGIASHAATSLAVTVDGADQVTVQPGAVVIAGDAVASTGAYRSALATPHTEALAARNATNPRVDLVVFRMLDTDVVGTHTQRRARLEVITGTPSATPAVPAKPSMAVEIARVNVPVNGGAAASVDSSRRTFAAALGAELLVTTFSQLPAAAAPWQRARCLDTGLVWSRDPASGTWFWDGADRWGGGEPAFVGAPPPAGARKITQIMTAVVNLGNDAGQAVADFNYNSAFPNGIVSVIATPGDYAVRGAQAVVPTGNGCTLAHFRGAVIGGTPGGLVRVNLAAWGW